MDWADPVVRLTLVVGLFVVGFGGFRMWKANSIRRVESGRALWPESLWSGGTTLVYFSGPNCSQCAAQERVLQEVAAADETIDLRKFDASVDTEIASLLGVLTVPTTVVIGSDGAIHGRNGRLVNRDTLEGQLHAAL